MKKTSIILFSKFFCIAFGLSSSVSATSSSLEPLNKNLALQVVADANNPNFVSVAEYGVQAVVHIKSIYSAKQLAPKQPEPDIENFFRDFFGRGPEQWRSAPSFNLGSGVIISDDGYIVTNNHVVGQADCVEITLADNRSYMAKIIGRDKATDIALLKIEEKNLKFLKFGDSDRIRVGEWVLAIGDPLTLTSTVTKGIVSAKARSVAPDLNDFANAGGGLRIDSFIQTDAVVNHGNSGGALINTNGELIGINTAMLGHRFFGYAFAVPSGVVEKVVQDLKLYGVARHTILGIKGRNLNAELAKEKNINRVSGVYVAEVDKNSISSVSGLKAGDVIIKVNSASINTLPELHLQLIKYKPNDSFMITIVRVNKELQLPIKIKSGYNHVSLNPDGNIVIAGATVENLTQKILNNLKITSGVYVKDIEDGPFKIAGIKKGWIIYKINNAQISDIVSFRECLAVKEELVIVTCLDSKGQEYNCLVDLRIAKK